MLHRPRLQPLFWTICLAWPTWGQEPPGDRDALMEGLRADLAQLHVQYEQLLDTTRSLQARLDALTTGQEEPEDSFFIPRRDSSEPAPQPTDHPSFARLGSQIAVGGYFDLEYRSRDTNGHGSFDPHRFVPLIQADISDRIKMAAEIEIEHGSDLEVEFAQVDLLLHDAFNVRAGVQLLPLGKLNEVHDSPLQDLTDRPLVDRFIIPTTLRDAGVGFFGQLGETVHYQAALTNGFKGLRDDGRNVITATSGLRKAAPHQENDTVGVSAFEAINDGLAATARIAWQPRLGTEVGLSALRDHYDEAGNNELGILALDATVDGAATTLLPDNLELLYEGAWADIERDAFARASGVAGDMRGYYVQANWRFEPDWLAALKATGGVGEEAHLKVVTRYGHVRLDTYDMRRSTLGIAFRPNAGQTVYRLDYQFNDDSGSAAGTHDDDVLLLSMATYF